MRLLILAKVFTEGTDDRALIAQLVFADEPLIWVPLLAPNSVICIFFLDNFYDKEIVMRHLIELRLKDFTLVCLLA